MKLRYSLLGALALGLASTGAYAQSTDTMAPPPADPAATPSQDPMAPPADPSAPASSMQSGEMPASDMPATDPSAMTGTATNTATTTNPATGATNTTVSSPPVPDTAENRARYGRPMSNAGRRSAARGN